jgi:opacity protein-like surface antigen
MSEDWQTGVTVVMEGVPMFRCISAVASFAVLISTAAFAQAVPPLLVSTPVSRTFYLSLDAVQAQVDATLRHAAASKKLIAVALVRPPLSLLPSTPIPRR